VSRCEGHAERLEYPSNASKDLVRKREGKGSPERLSCRLKNVIKMDVTDIECTNV
jgi:hypothetical protein